jgi:hypothetical protein
MPTWKRADLEARQTTLRRSLSILRQQLDALSRQLDIEISPLPRIQYETQTVELEARRSQVETDLGLIDEMLQARG